MNDILNWLTSTVGSLPDEVIWGLGGLFALLESGLGLGFLVPGETVVLLLAATVDSPQAALILFIVVVIGASAGDHVGYGIGRHFGPRMRETKIIRKLGVAKWDQAVEILERRGAAAVFLTRLIPVIRTLVPAAAGVAKVPYKSFLPASLAGAATWSTLYVGLGYLVRSSLEAMQMASALWAGLSSGCSLSWGQLSSFAKESTRPSPPWVVATPQPNRHPSTAVRTL